MAENASLPGVPPVRATTEPVSGVLSAADAATHLGVHVETLRRLARRGEVPCFKVGKDWRFQRSALERWMAAQTPAARAPGEAPARSGPPRVLIVDDEADVGRVLVRMITAAGAEGIAVTSGHAGLAAVEAAPPDLVLVDLLMPGMDGAQFMSALRRRHPAMPVVIVTGYPDGEVMMRAAEHGPILLLNKPVEPEHVGRALRMVLGDRLDAVRPRRTAPGAAPPW